MNIFKKIVLINKINKRIKEAKKLIDANQGLAKRATDTIEVIQTNVRELASLLPMLKDLEKDIIDIIKG